MKPIEKINKSKSWVFGKVNKIDKYQARLADKKRRQLISETKEVP